jgi:hypothetical protein
MAWQTNTFPQQQLKYDSEWCSLCSLCQGVINGTSLEFSQLWDIRQLVRTLAEDNVQIRYEEMTAEDTEDFMCAAVIMIFRVCKPVRLLYLLVDTICK